MERIVNPITFDRRELKVIVRDVLLLLIVVDERQVESRGGRESWQSPVPKD